MYYLTPITSALIGYLTNKMAIKMLFYPRKSVLGIQGLLIKRKAEIARSLSHVIVDRLLANGASGIMSDKQLKKVCDNIADAIITDFEKHEPGMTNYKSMLHSFIRDYISQLIKDPIPQTSDALSDMKSTIVANILAIPDTEIETIITEISIKEFKAIEVIGAVVGFIIGLLNMYVSGV